MLEARTVTCPYCWQAIEILLDRSVGGQQYVEDCSVCCRPIVVRYGGEGEEAELEVVAENNA